MFGFGKSNKSDNNGAGELTQTLIKLLDCPCEVFREGTEPQKITNAYEDAFARREFGRYTPMIIVIDDVLAENFELYEKNADDFKAERGKLLSTPQINAQKWFKDKLTEWKNEMGGAWNETVGEVADGDVMKTFSGFVNYSTQKSDECILAKIPVTNPWEVFAWLPFGGWNECPNPEEIMWISKYWYERYGAVPAVMTHDVLEFSARPVKDRDAALGAALEQFAFCSDIVFQGVDTIGRLADSLMKSSIWYFWWD